MKNQMLKVSTENHVYGKRQTANGKREFEPSDQNNILGDPEADSGGEGKSKRAEKYGTKEK